MKTSRLSRTTTGLYHMLPSALHNGSPISLALQLSCSVLVVACPCALGLATPTAMLVGTSLGARRGLLLRGGDILEKFSSVDTVVFDKTGTLTKGHPVVTEVIILEDPSVAAAVESNTTHPVGKAIVKAAQAHNCQTMKAEDGTFTEEPGSGAVAIVNSKRVAVGTLEWVQSLLCILGWIIHLLLSSALKIKSGKILHKLLGI